MNKLIDELSPCLHLCTVVFHFRDDRYLASRKGFLLDITLCLSLKQVRRHAGHLYTVPEAQLTVAVEKAVRYFMRVDTHFSRKTDQI